MNQQTSKFSINILVVIWRWAFWKGFLIKVDYKTDTTKLSWPLIEGSRWLYRGACWQWFYCNSLILYKKLSFWKMQLTTLSLSLCLSVSLSLCLSLYLSFVNCMKEEYHIFFKNVTLLKTLKTIKFLIIFPTLNKSRIAFYQCSRFALMTDVMNLEKDIVDSNGRRISLHKIKSWKV